MAEIACSLHPLDVRLLKIFMSSLQGSVIPDLREEVARRRQRDILTNWSHKIIRAAAPLAGAVPREKWTLYTQLRPFFITVDDPEAAAQLTERFLAVHSLPDILNLYREEVARIDAERADAVVELAKKDNEPPVIEPLSVDDIADNMRAYLIHQRRQLQAMAGASMGEDHVPANTNDAGRWLAWRTCHLLANFHPSWYVRTTSLTNLAERAELGLVRVIADPRGMYKELADRIPGLYERIPYRLDNAHQTGLCISPKAVPAMLALMDEWPQPLMPHPTLGVPAPAEVQALREALLFARNLHAGLWEASHMAAPEEGIYPQILTDQAAREEHPEKFLVPSAALSATATVAETPQGEPAKNADFAELWERTRPIGETDAAASPEGDAKVSWFNKLRKR